MGFDLYGLNPVNPDNLVRPTIDWSKKNSKETEKKYFAAVETYEDAVTGSYFRNNVWFWRPLWNYVYDTTDVLTDEDHRLGHENSCHPIGADKAVRIGLALLDNIKDAEAKEAEYIKDSKPRRKFNKLCDKAADCLYDEVVDKSDGLITCPGDMKIHDPANYKRWSTLSHFGGGIQFGETSYPFSAANVKEFANFCLNSGGFEIG